MAKTAPLKGKNGKILLVKPPHNHSFLTYSAPSKHSRAVRRAASPSINTDKSLKEVKPPTEIRQPVLEAHTGSGIKKSKGRKAVLSAKARKRQEKGMDRAEAVMDRTEKKIEKSKGRARNVQDRSKAWEDLNKKALLEKALAQKAKDEQDGNWEDLVDEDGDEQSKIDTGTDEIEMEGIAATEDDPVIPTVTTDTVEDEDLIL